jgi:conjugal transfer pilin signal peptidase TrbI
MTQTLNSTGLVQQLQAWPHRSIGLVQQLRGHFQKFWLLWLIPLAITVVFQTFFKVGINVTNSLPQSAFLVTKFDQQLKRGDYLSFSWTGAYPYPMGVEFIKIVKGMPGDVVSYKGRDVFINGEYVATAKPFSQSRKALELGPSGVIPVGKFFVYATHPESLDSRYALTGFIDRTAVRGRAYPIF